MYRRLTSLVSRNKRIFSNFSYLAILEIFSILAPIITFPYLVRVLGKELYGWVILAQATSFYATILIDFGFRRVSAKYVAAVRNSIEELSRVVSTVMMLRVILWIATFILYMSVVYMIPSYREQWVLFLFSYGMTLNSLLLPDFYFQGIEQMRYITIVNVFTRLVFILATFILITQPYQYIYVPLTWSAGYLIGGLYSLHIVYNKHNLRFLRPGMKDYRYHLKETTPIFLSDVMLNIKDKLSYNFMGGILGMSDVVIYDIGTKMVNLLVKPTFIFSNAIFPSMSRNPDVRKTKKILGGLFLLSIVMVSVIYVFLPQIVKFFINEEIDLLPLRIYLLVPIFTGLSYYIPTGVFVVFGRNKYVLYSTIFSSCSYVIMLAVMWIGGWLTSITSFILVIVTSYIVEAIFRLYLSTRIFIEHTNNNPNS